jgi:hypothetical protein
MSAHPRQPLRAAPYVAMLIAAIAIYVVITLAAPVDTAIMKYGLTETAVRLLQLTIVVPVIVIWAVASFGSFQTRRYGRSIDQTAEGSAFAKLGNGLGFLAASIIVSGLVGAVRPFVLDSHSQTAAVQIVVTYLYIVLPLIGFWLIHRASQRLLGSTHGAESRRAKLVCGVVAVLLAAILSWVLLGNEYRNDSPDPNQFSSYYLSDFFLFATVVLPYAVMWWLGLLAASNIGRYARRVSGLLYQQFFRRVAWGLYGVIGFSIILQFLSAAAPSLANADLESLLGILYLLIIFYGVGYALIASGAKRLRRIEEV